jgi:type 1 fimbriae regulatory protein FimB/type 1 fimbriae regulatory protein FimE
MSEQNMMKPPLKLVFPARDKRAVGPVRRPNKELRPRGEHLTESEVAMLADAARSNRHGHRDAAIIWMTYRHGLRAAEVCDLRWEQVDLATASLHVTRAKGGDAGTHPCWGMNSECCASSRGMPRNHPMFSSQNVAHRSRCPASIGW